MPMAFIDLQAQRKRIESEINTAIQAVIESGRYVLGPEVGELESQLAAYCGATHAVSCANGTDALALALMAWELKPGDAVFCPSFTFVATAQVVPWLGATPVFVDICEDTYKYRPGTSSCPNRSRKGWGQAQSESRYCRRSFRPTRELSRDQGTLRRIRPEAYCRHRTRLRLYAERSTPHRLGRHCNDKLFSGQAAWVLWGWRRNHHK